MSRYIALIGLYVNFEQALYVVGGMLVFFGEFVYILWLAEGAVAKREKMI